MIHDHLSFRFDSYVKSLGLYKLVLSPLEDCSFFKNGLFKHTKSLQQRAWFHSEKGGLTQFIRLPISRYRHGELVGCFDLGHNDSLRPYLSIYTFLLNPLFASLIVRSDDHVVVQLFCRSLFSSVWPPKAPKSRRGTNNIKPNFVLVLF